MLEEREIDMKICFLIMLSFTIPALTLGQTIKTIDLPHFVGALERPNPENYDSLNTDKFVDWYITQFPPEISLDTFCRSQDTDMRRQWYSCFELENPDEWAPPWEGPIASIGPFKYVMLKDVCGFESQNNVLTVWRGNDTSHVALSSIERGPFGTAFGRVAVRRIVPFPDSSLLLHVWTSSEDDGWEDAIDIFLRSTDSLHFEPFLEIGWNSMDSTKRYVIADHIGLPGYKVLEITEFFASEASSYTHWPEAEISWWTHALDTAQVRVLDLWSLAQQHFSIRQPVDTSAMK